MKIIKTVVASVATAGLITFTAANAGAVDIVSTTPSQEKPYVDPSFVPMDRNSDTAAAIDKINYLDGEQRTRLDGRDNEISDRNFANELGNASAVHYDGDKVVKTDRDLHDTQTGTVLRDRKGNAIKERELVKGSDTITFRGDNGTQLKNVANGVDANDAVNVSQLKDVDAKVQQNTDRLGGVEETQKAHSQALVKESEEREKGYKTNGDRITALAQEKAGQADVDKMHADTNARIDTTNTNLDKEAAVRAESVDNLQQQLHTKVSHDEFVADQKRQDERADKDRANTRSELNAKVNVNTYQNQLKVDQAKTATAQQAADTAQANVSRETVAREADTQRLDKAKADRTELDKAVKDQAQVNEKVVTTQNSHGLRITDLEGRATTNEQAITEVNSNAIAREQQLLTTSKAYVDRTRDELNGRIDGVERKAYSGVAASMAMTGLSPVIHADKSAMSVAVGSYASQAAVAVGYSKRFADDATTLRINGAVADRHVGGAVGLTHEF